jgi:hypothetical protein
LTLCRRHLAVADALKQQGALGASGQDLAAGNEAVAVKDMAEAAFGIGGAMAAGTVALEDGTGTHGQIVRSGHSEHEVRGDKTTEQGGAEAV